MFHFLLSTLVVLAGGEWKGRLEEKAPTKRSGLVCLSCTLSLSNADFAEDVLCDERRKKARLGAATLLFCDYSRQELFRHFVRDAGIH